MYLYHLVLYDFSHRRGKRWRLNMSTKIHVNYYKPALKKTVVHYKYNILFSRTCKLSARVLKQPGFVNGGPWRCRLCYFLLIFDPKQRRSSWVGIIYLSNSYRHIDARQGLNSTYCTLQRCILRLNTDSASILIWEYQRRQITSAQRPLE
jgi:hypothetical protein